MHAFLPRVLFVYGLKEEIRGESLMELRLVDLKYKWYVVRIILQTYGKKRKRQAIHWKKYIKRILRGNKSMKNGDNAKV